MAHIFGTELIHNGKFVAHHPEAERITTDCGSDHAQAIQTAYDEDDDCEFQNGGQIAVSKMCNWLPTVEYVDRLIDDLAEAAGEDCGEVAENYLEHVTPAQADDLARRIQEAVRAWLQEIYPDGSPFWMAQDAVLYTVNLPPDIVARRAEEEAKAA